MDNLSSHKVAGVKEAIESVGAEVLYLPPYSPDLNPIENVKQNSFLRLKTSHFFQSKKSVASDVAQTIFRCAPAGAGSVPPLSYPKTTRKTGQMEVIRGDIAHAFTHYHTILFTS